MSSLRLPGLRGCVLGLAVLGTAPLAALAIADAPSAQARDRWLVTLGVVSSGVALLAWLLARRRVARPIRALVVAAREVVERGARAAKDGEPGVARNGRLSTLVDECALLAAALQARREEHSQTLSSLEEGLAQRNALLDATPGGYATVGADGAILEFSSGATEVFGYAGAEAVGKDAVGLLVPEALQARMRRRLARAATPRGARFLDRRLETSALRKDGTRFDVELILARVAGGGPIRFVVWVRDITRLKEVQGKFLEAQKMEAVGRMAGGIAHDFNNSLTAITGFSQLLLGRLGKESPHTANVQQIRRAADRAAALSRQMLTFSRRQAVSPASIDLNAVLKDVAAMLRAVVGEKVDLQLVPGEGLGRVKADPGQIEQVVVNLVVNARDAMPRGGTLTIGTENATLDEDSARGRGVPPGDHVVLSVSDTGTGIPKDIQGRIFEPFFTTKERGKGTGLGLSTCQRLVEQSDGCIRVESEPGHGATFRVYLPRLGEQAPQTTGQARAEPAERGTETLLVVEDEPAVRDMAFQVLKDLGYTVLTAADGVEALGAVRAHGPGGIQLVITDVVMPRVGGWELSVSLREMVPDIRVLLTSAYLDDEAPRHVLQSPGIAFLPKPYTPEGLARKVRWMLDS